VARRAVQRWLESSGSPTEEVQAVALVCTEACANAVQHPVGALEQAFEIELTRTAAEVAIVVRDFGGWGAATSTDERGRGLELIRSLMHSTEIVTGDRGTELVMRRARRRTT